MEKDSTEKINIIFATADSEEHRLFDMVIQERKLPYFVFYPGTISEVEEVLESSKIDIIITDLHFQQGGFADWLFLWPYPFIVFTEPEEHEHLGEVINNEVCSFLYRMPEGRHVMGLPVMIKKILNTRESLDRQNQHIQVSERRYLNLVQALPDVVYTLDEEGRFSFVNNSVRRLGYDPVELIGKHFSYIVAPEDVIRVSREQVLPVFKGRITGPERSPRLFDERRTGSRMTRGLQLKLKRQQEEREPETWGSVIAYGEVCSVGYSELGLDQLISGTAGIIRDISGRLQRMKQSEPLDETEEGQETRVNDLKSRIFGTLQLISSLLSIQQSESQELASHPSFIDLQMQIYSLSLIYKEMHHLSGTEEINLQSFIIDLANHIITTYSLNPWSVELEAHADGINIDAEKLIPLALLINEILSASVLYSLKDREKGKIIVTLTQDGENLIHMQVWDNGSGFELESQDQEGRLVLLIGQALLQQLNGQASRYSDDRGSRISVFINGSDKKSSS